jgi:hypothetical protein
MKKKSQYRQKKNLNFVEKLERCLMDIDHLFWFANFVCKHNYVTLYINECINWFAQQ